MTPSAPCGLEVAAGSLACALTAQTGGAMRVELCGGLAHGGLTPSWASVAMARERLSIPLHVLVRPRDGDFVYEADEVELMRRDIAACQQLGCDGVVIGALDRAGSVDRDACIALIDAAADMQVTFHRAFDLAADQSRALEDIIALGCTRVLTSGAANRAIDGCQRIAELHTQAAGRIGIMPGAGIEAAHLATLRHLTGAREFHASARRAVPATHNGVRLDGLTDTCLHTDLTCVRQLVAILRADAACADEADLKARSRP